MLCLTPLSLLSIAFHRLRGMKHRQHIPVPHAPTWEASRLPSGYCKTWQLYCIPFTSASNYIHVSGRNMTSPGRILLTVIKIKSILADKNHSFGDRRFLCKHWARVSARSCQRHQHWSWYWAGTSLCIREEPWFHSSTTSTAWNELKTEVYLVT